MIDFYEDYYYPVWCRTFLDVAGGVWISSESMHEMLELLRVNALKYRLSCEACPDLLVRYATVKFPPVVIK